MKRFLFLFWLTALPVLAQPWTRTDPAWMAQQKATSGGGAGGSPLFLTNGLPAVLYWDASLESYSDGATASIAHDFSGNGNSATTQSGTYTAPTFKASWPALNGKSAFNFDTINQALASSYNLIAPYTLVLVCATNPAVSYNSSYFSRAVAATDLNSLVAPFRQGLLAYVQGGISTINFINSNAVAVLQITNSASSFLVNGANATSVTTVYNNWGTVSLGAANPYSETAGEFIAAVVAYKPPLTGVQQASVNNYCMTNWGINQ